MASCKADDLRKFKIGGEFPICVQYLGRGPDSGDIPDHVLERRNPISGKLTFSMQRVSFYSERDVINDPLEECTHKPSFIGIFSDKIVNFNYPMYLVDCEKLSEDNKIFFITLNPCISIYDQRRIYFDVSDPKNESCNVYYPQWVEVAKRLNKKDFKEKILKKLHGACDKFLK